MSSCAACSGVEGATHTCGGSGTFLAAEAHGAGAVEIAQESEWPRYEVTMHLRLRQPDEDAVRARLTRMVGDLLDDDLVESADFSLRLWEVAI